MRVVTMGGQVKKNVLFIAAWVVLLSLAAFLLPPLDSRANPAPLLARSFIVATLLLSTYTLVKVFAYLVRSWQRVGAVPNRMEYATWLGLQTVVFLAILVWVFAVAVPVVAHRLKFLL